MNSGGAPASSALQPYSFAMLLTRRSKIMNPLSEFAMIATPRPESANAVR